MIWFLISSFNETYLYVNVTIGETVMCDVTHREQERTIKLIELFRVVSY